jgi:hypothetical protein
MLASGDQLIAPVAATPPRPQTTREGPVPPASLATTPTAPTEDAISTSFWMILLRALGVIHS